MVKNYNVELDVITPVIINNGEIYDYCELIPKDKECTINDNQEKLSLPKIYYSSTSNVDFLFKGLDFKYIDEFIKKSSDALLSRNEKERNDKLKSLRANLMSQRKDTKGMLPGRMLEEAHSELSEKPMQEVKKIITQGLTSYPLIPGSSIKGAIRTAYLENLRENKKLDYWSNNRTMMNDDADRKVCYKQSRDAAKYFEKKLLIDNTGEDITKDPFKYLKISDFSFDGRDNMIYVGKIDNSRRIPIYSAMTSSYAFCAKAVTAKGTISFDDEFFKQRRMDDGFESILENVDSFYWKNYKYKPKIENNNISTTRNRGNRSLTALLADDNNSQKQRLMDQVHNKIIKEHKNGFFIRLGHYIGIQNYTFNVNQVCPPKKASNDININGGKAKTIEGGVIPGICLMRIIGEDE